MSPRSNHTQTSYLYISGNIDWYLNGVNTSYNNPLLRAVLMFRVIYCHLWAEYGPQQWWCVTCPLAGSSSLLDIREPPGCWNLWAFIARGWLNSKPPYDHTRTNVVGQTSDTSLRFFLYWINDSALWKYGSYDPYFQRAESFIINWVTHVEHYNTFEHIWTHTVLNMLKWVGVFKSVA